MTARDTLLNTAAAILPLDLQEVLKSAATKRRSPNRRPANHEAPLPDQSSQLRSVAIAHTSREWQGSDPNRDAVRGGLCEAGCRASLYGWPTRVCRTASRVTLNRCAGYASG